MSDTNSGWCLSGELSREQSETLENSIESVAEAHFMFPPTLSRFEQRNTPLWRIDIFLTDQPHDNFVHDLLAHANIADWHYELAPVEDRDWVSESQKLLAPVRAGRFLVFGSHDADKAENSCINLQIDAGQAFGTGKHETTAACLHIIDGLVDKQTPAKILDVGTGTGVLALAAHKVWPNSHVVATDIDPIAIDVARENLAVNHTFESHGSDTPGIQLAVADGMQAKVLNDNAPFELIIANILAGPLIDMAADITAALSKSGHIILSGLLIEQINDVLAAYAHQGLKCLKTIEMGDWAALYLGR